MIVFLLAVQPSSSDSYNDLVLSQKMHDVLLVWQKEKNFSLNELKADFEFVFPLKSGRIEIENAFVDIGLQKNFQKNFTEEISVIDDEFTEKKIKLTVFD